MQRTVNPSSTTSMVRIHPCPPLKLSLYSFALEVYSDFLFDLIFSDKILKYVVFWHLKIKMLSQKLCQISDNFCIRICRQNRFYNLFELLFFICVDFYFNL